MVVEYTAVMGVVMSNIEDFKARVEILEAAVDLLEERLNTLMSEQKFEPYIVELSDKDTDKIKKWIKE